MNDHLGLSDLVADEPPFVLRPDAAIAAGRRRRRIRAVGTTITAGATAVVAVGSFSLLSSPASPQTTVNFGGQPTASAVNDTGDTNNVYYRIARAHTPAGWTFKDGVVDNLSGYWANVDDGVHGPGRLGLFHSTSGLQQHPCSDSEFRDKADSCVETMLDSDTRLIVRSVSRSNPINTVFVVIVHSDGSGVDVTDDNATWPAAPPSGSISTVQEKRALSHGTIGSTVPLYSTDTLVEIAKDLDAATR